MASSCNIVRVGELELEKVSEKKYIAHNHAAKIHLKVGNKDGVYRTDESGTPFMTETEYKYFLNKLNSR
jgi:hypothetical protein